LIDAAPLETAFSLARTFTSQSRFVLGAREAVERALDVPVHEGLKPEAHFSTHA